MKGVFASQRVLFVKVLGPLGEGINHRENGGTFGMVSFIIAPLYILGS